MRAQAIMTRRDIVQHLRILVQRWIHQANGTSLASPDSFFDDPIEEGCHNRR
jgi:hypothetical protein